LANMACIAAASDIFEQQCVIQIAHGDRRKAEFSSQAHAEQTSAQGMPGYGVLGEIKRERQSRE
jgi:hypothetical protein